MGTTVPPRQGAPRSTESDMLAPMRGIVYGLALSLVVWTIVGVVIWLLV